MVGRQRRGLPRKSRPFFGGQCCSPLHCDHMRETTSQVRRGLPFRRFLVEREVFEFTSSSCHVCPNQCACANFRVRTSDIGHGAEKEGQVEGRFRVSNI